MSLSKTQLPRKTSILDTGPARGTSATIVTRDQDMISLSLSNTRSNNTNANLRNQLDRNPRSGVRALEVVNKLFQILNGIDIVVRRWGNQSNTRSRVTSMSDGTNDLMTRQFTTLTRLRTLGHLNLQLIGISQIVRCNTETTRRNLLDGRPHSVTVFHSLATLGIFTTLTRVRLATKTIHCNGQSRVRFH